MTPFATTAFVLAVLAGAVAPLVGGSNDAAVTTSGFPGIPW